MNNINRRRFIQGTTAALALTAIGAKGMSILSNNKTLKVGLIGAGWYGKSDLFKLIQVAPINVVAICDVDKNHLTEASKMISERQLSGKAPLLYGDYRKM